MPEDVQKAMKDFPNEFKTIEESIGKQETKYAGYQKSEEYTTFFQKYAVRENLSNSFVDSRKMLAHAVDLFNNKLKPLYEKNEEKDVATAKICKEQIDIAKKDALRLMEYPMKRANFIRQAKAQAPQLIRTADKEYTQLEKIYEGLQKVSEQTKNTHENKKAEIEAKMLPIQKSYENAKNSYAAAKSEFKTQLPDYAILGDGCALVSSTLKYLVDGDKKTRAKLGELDRSFTKILADMKVDHYVVIGRVSWEESEAIEWPTETEYLYPVRQVDESAYEYFDKWEDGKDIGHLGGWFSRSFSPDESLNGSIWNKLKIDPKEKWPSSDNEADYFIVELPIRFFQKYIIVEDGKKTETDWVEVTESEFEKNEDNLGMAIVSKAYGQFSEESLNIASPPGMGFVGNKKYGQWQKDPSTGTNFWVFYGQYRLFSDMLGGGRYYQNDWNDWSNNYRGRRPYYGGDKDEKDRFGSGGIVTQSNPRYAGSHYARTGGFKSEDASARGAGPARRAGGPGGGGK